jgi:hypothetical protein
MIRIKFVAAAFLTAGEMSAGGGVCAQQQGAPLQESRRPN